MAFAAVCAAAVLILADVFVAARLSAEAQSAYSFAVRSALYALAAVAAGTAAGRVGWWSGYAGRAWTLFSLEFVLLLVNYLLRRSAPGATAALDATLVAANLAQIAAYWLMARMLAAAGMGHLTSPAKKILLTVVALGVAIALCHVSLEAQWQSLRAGEIKLGSLVSVLADVVTFTLIAPLAMSMLALRGGSLSWIFGLLTASVFGWMVNTGAPSIAALFGGAAGAPRSIRTAGVVIAALFNAAAAAAQSMAAIRAMKGADVRA